VKPTFIRRLGIGALLLACGCTTDLSAPDQAAPTRDLTGVVLDAEGFPLADASVSLIYTLGLHVRTYGNEAKPRTGISFSVPRGGAIVRVEILDYVGQSVRLLQDGPVEEGQYVATWDGNDDKGNPSPNGVYHVQLEMISETEHVLEDSKVLFVVVDLDELVNRPNARTDLNGRFAVPREMIPVGEMIDFGTDSYPISTFVTVQAAIETSGGIRRSIRDIEIPLEGDLEPLEFSLP
jgi:hypothetical protein